jgi:menaquinone-dependent protoporphyrinogen oxidase
MPPRRVLVVYATTHGQTGKIAEHVARRLEARGHVVTLVDADELPRFLSARDFDAVVVGSSVTFGRHQKCVRRFVRAERDALNDRPSAFFSVSGSAAGRTDAARAEARRYADELLGESGWRPAHVAIVAGALAYTRYNPLLRWVMRRIAAQNGTPTDTSRDHEMTDWAQVDGFAAAFAGALAGPLAGALAGPLARPTEPHQPVTA